MKESDQRKKRQKEIEMGKVNERETKAKKKVRILFDDGNMTRE